MRTKFWMKNLKGRDYSKDVYIDDRIILKWILRNRLRICTFDLIASEQKPLAGFSEHRNKPPTSINCRQFFD
jgi:hypothetical protein